MATSTKYELQIIPCDMCNGCINKVKKVLRRLAGVKLLTTDFENEKFTISSVVEHPEVIKFAIEQEFRRKRVILLPEINHPNPLVPTQYMPIPQNLSSRGGNARVHDMPEALVTLFQTQGLQSGEFTQTNTLRINFTNNEYQQNTSRNSPPLPPPNTQPSAPIQYPFLFIHISFVILYLFTPINSLGTSPTLCKSVLSYELVMHQVNLVMTNRFPREEVVYLIMVMEIDTTPPTLVTTNVGPTNEGENGVVERPSPITPSNIASNITLNNQAPSVTPMHTEIVGILKLL
ncbi:heavy metal-associated domain, HMA containing protein [Tanacetum coccineum]